MSFSIHPHRELFFASDATLFDTLARVINRKTHISILHFPIAKIRNIMLAVVFMYRQYDLNRQMFTELQLFLDSIQDEDLFLSVMFILGQYEENGTPDELIKTAILQLPV